MKTVVRNCNCFFSRFHAFKTTQTNLGLHIKSYCSPGDSELPKILPFLIAKLLSEVTVNVYKSEERVSL
jgi:hypothetical protein